jgi:putative intracellular protease/amidase
LGTTPSKKHCNWPYAGYQMTVFSTAEEKPNELGGPSSALGGCVPFYPESALKAAGGDVSVVAPGKSHIVIDRELFTGQNPASDKELSAAFIKALSLVP